MERRIGLLVSALQVPDGLLFGSVPDCGHVFPDLLVESCEPFPFLLADAGLPLLVYDLVETLVQEDGEALAAVFGCGDVIGVVVGYLADIIGDIGHKGDDRTTGVGHPAVKRAIREIEEDPHSTIRPAYPVKPYR